MSQISTHHSPPPPDNEPVFTPRASSLGAPAVVAPQARREFDAALQRADQGDSEPEEDKTEKTAADAAPGGLAALGALLPLAGGIQHAPAGQAEGLGGAAGSALPQIRGGALPDAVPMAAGSPIAATAAGQQWRVTVPGDAAGQSPLALRLVNSGAGHWQLRLATDTQTRQQLTPHLDRLRDKLRQRSGGRMDDLGFEDDLGAGA